MVAFARGDAAQYVYRQFKFLDTFAGRGGFLILYARRSSLFVRQCCFRPPCRTFACAMLTASASASPAHHPALESTAGTFVPQCGPIAWPRMCSCGLQVVPLSKVFCLIGGAIVMLFGVLNIFVHFILLAPPRRVVQVLCWEPLLSALGKYECTSPIDVSCCHQRLVATHRRSPARRQAG
jgi:hypothetical protein